MVLPRLILGLELPESDRTLVPLDGLPPTGSASSSEEYVDRADCGGGMIVLAEEGERVGKLDIACEKEDGLGK